MKDTVTVLDEDTGIKMEMSMSSEKRPPAIERLKGKNIVVYDCEIENVIDGVNVTWSTHDKMGLSVACLYDYRTDDWHVYLKNDLQAICDRLKTADLVVGFNTEGFDEKLLRGLGGDMPEKIKNFDMLYHSRIATGWNPKDRFPKGLRLDNHLEHMFGKENMKTTHGENAPIWWQEGRHGEVISYCLADVKRERMLFEHIVEHGWVSTEEHGKRYIDLSVINRVLEMKPTTGLGMEDW